MKIRNRLYLNIGTSIALIVILTLLLFDSFLKINEELEKQALANEFSVAIGNLVMVTDSYLAYGYTRAEQQIDSKLKDINETIKKAEGKVSLDIMQRALETLKGALSNLKINYQEKKELIEKNASQEEIERKIETEKRLTAVIRSESQKISASSLRISSEAQQKVATTQKNTYLLVLSFAVFLCLIIGVFMFFTSKSITKPIEKLTRGADIIGKGNLEHRIDIISKDETGQLATAFNKMAGSLSKRNEEVIQKTKELEKAKTSLEEKVKERTAELEIAKNRSEVLLASIGDGVFAIDRESNIIHFNRRAEEISGYKASEVLGKPYYDFLKFVKVKDRSENIAFIRTALKGEATTMADHTVLIRKDKKELPVADSAAPIKDKQERILGAIVVFRDATQERQIERMRAELISLTGHQLKTPLVSIKGYVEMLKESRLGTEAKEHAGKIERGIKAMTKLVGDVLNISRIEQGRIEIKLEPTRLEEIVNSLIKDLLPLAKKRKVSIEFTKPPEPLLEVNADPKYLQEAIQNIISNAINYTKDKVVISLEKLDSELRFACTDNGIGIPKEEQSKIFTKFYRASNVAKTGIEGTGLGLSITKAIVEEQHKGKIWFESEEGKGTTFYIALPFII